MVTAPMMYCTKRRPSFTLVKEGKTNQRSAFGIPQPLHGASVDFFLKVAFSSSSLPFNVQRLVRSAVLHQAKVFYMCFTFCGCYSSNLHYHRRDACKLSSCPASACRRIGFHLSCPLPHMNAEAKICTKRFMGPGETRHKQPQTRCKLWFNKKHQRNKSKLI